MVERPAGTGLIGDIIEHDMSIPNEPSVFSLHGCGQFDQIVNLQEAEPHEPVSGRFADARIASLPWSPAARIAIIFAGLDDVAKQFQIVLGQVFRFRVYRGDSEPGGERVLLCLVPELHIGRRHAEQHAQVRVVHPLDRGGLPVGTDGSHGQFEIGRRRAGPVEPWNHVFHVTPDASGKIWKREIVAVE